jgi:PBSX family phage terminase large subunit
MLLEPLPASSWFSVPELVRDLKYLRGDTKIAFPCNDVFIPDWNSIADILLLIGGYGGGKSQFVVANLLNRQMNDKYYRLYYGRKVYDTVRASCFDTFCDTIEYFKLEDEFEYSRKEKSSMVIKSKVNRNFARPFVIDKADKVKSIKDPSHIWMEEADQFTSADFGLLLSRLRTSKTKTQLILTCNTEKLRPEHWIVTQILNNADNRQSFNI